MNSQVFQSYHEAMTVNPFGKYSWQAKPFKEKNMPRDDPTARKHTSLRATLHHDEHGWWHVLDAKGMTVPQAAQEFETGAAANATF